MSFPMGTFRYWISTNKWWKFKEWQTQIKTKQMKHKPLSHLTLVLCLEGLEWGRPLMVTGGEASHLPPSPPADPPPDPIQFPPWFCSSISPPVASHLVALHWAPRWEDVSQDPDQQDQQDREDDQENQGNDLEDQEIYKGVWKQDGSAPDGQMPGETTGENWRDIKWKIFMGDNHTFYCFLHWFSVEEKKVWYRVKFSKQFSSVYT